MPKDFASIERKLLWLACFKPPGNDFAEGQAQLAGIVHTLLTERSNSRRYRIALADLAMRANAAKESPHNLLNK